MERDGLGLGGVGSGDVGVAGEPRLSQVLGVAGMGDEACLDLLARAARSTARWQAMTVWALARFAALRPPTERGERNYSEFATDEVAPVLGLSPAMARTRMAQAVALVSRLPATVAALEDGMIDLERAVAMAEITGGLDDAGALAVEQTVLALGGRPTRDAFRRAVRRAVLNADPDGADRRRRTARERRCVRFKPGEDGVADLCLTLPAELAQAAYARLTALARKAACPEDPRTLDQRRADVAAALLLLDVDADDEDVEGGGGGVSVEVHVTVPATTLLGLADEPGELEGYGPIPCRIMDFRCTAVTFVLPSLAHAADLPHDQCAPP
jgi:hypothetical protein